MCCSQHWQVELRIARGVQHKSIKQIIGCGVVTFFPRARKVSEGSIAIRTVPSGPRNLANMTAGTAIVGQILIQLREEIGSTIWRSLGGRKGAGVWSSEVKKQMEEADGRLSLRKCQ